MTSNQENILVSKGKTFPSLLKRTLIETHAKPAMPEGQKFLPAFLLICLSNTGEGEKLKIQ